MSAWVLTMLIFFCVFGSMRAAGRRRGRCGTDRVDESRRSEELGWITELLADMSTRLDRIEEERDFYRNSAPIGTGGGLRHSEAQVLPQVRTLQGTRRLRLAHIDTRHASGKRDREVLGDIMGPKGDQSRRPKGRRLFRASTTRLARGKRGQGLVELVLAIPVLMVLFFGIYEFSRYYSARLRIRSTVAEAARFAATGNQLTDPVTGDPLSRALSIRTKILSEVGPLGVTSGDITLSPADGGQTS